MKKGTIVDSTKKGTIVDSTIIENSTSKRNKDKARDPESSWTKKGGNYKHGFKSHIGVDANSGLITSNMTTAAKVHDVNCGNELLHGDEEAVYGDSGFSKPRKPPPCSGCKEVPHYEEAIYDKKAARRGARSRTQAPKSHSLRKSQSRA